MEDQEWEQFVIKKKVETSSPKEYEHDEILKDTYNKKRALPACLSGENSLTESPIKRLGSLKRRKQALKVTNKIKRFKTCQACLSMVCLLM